MEYFIYLARCSDASLYTGSCSDLAKRESDHNKGRGAIYTKYRRPVKIIYHETFNDRISACRREKQIKGWTRLKKENLIKFGHPNKLLTK
ncbi:MAG: GIY-YIG nuclease family protein [Patescibacteria group bacterium]